MFSYSSLNKLRQEPSSLYDTHSPELSPGACGHLPGTRVLEKRECSDFLSLDIMVPLLVCWLLSHVPLFATPGTVATRLLCPWNFPGKDTRAGYHFLLQEIFQTQGSNPCLLCLLPWQMGSLPLHYLGSLVLLLEWGFWRPGDASSTGPDTRSLLGTSLWRLKSIKLISGSLWQRKRCWNQSENKG